MKTTFLTMQNCGTSAYDNFLRLFQSGLKKFRHISESDGFDTYQTHFRIFAASSLRLVGFLRIDGSWTHQGLKRDQHSVRAPKHGISTSCA